MLPGLQTQVRITRAELEDALRPALRETVGSLRRAIDASGVALEDVKAIVLAGGSSRIPLVTELVSELGRPVALDAHPKHTVALGAARPRCLDQPDQSTAPVVVPPVATPPAEAPPGPPPGPTTPAGPPPDRAPGRSKVLLAGLVVGVAVLIGGLAVLLTGVATIRAPVPVPRPPRRPTPPTR